MKRWRGLCPIPNPSLLLIVACVPWRAERGNAARLRLYFVGYVNREAAGNLMTLYMLTAWKRNSANFAITAFSEVRQRAFSAASSRTPYAWPLANPNHLASKIRGAHPSLKTLTTLGVSTVTCGAMA